MRRRAVPALGATPVGSGQTWKEALRRHVLGTGRAGTRRRRGAALYLATVAVLVFAGLTTAIMTFSLSTKREREAAMQRTQRRYLAEAGISTSLVELTAGSSGAVATADAPQAFGEGHFFVTVTDHGDRSFTIDSSGIVGEDSRTMRCVARDVTEGVFDHAMFAGNADGDPSYSLDLGGTGGQADAISGDIYSGGDVVITGDATASGTLRAGGTISGGTGEEGASQPIPDIAGANYDVNHDIDVAAAFRDGSPTYQWDELGGNAWQLPEDDPAHIFRLNPSDRSTEYIGTAKDDYFLEDPYEAVSGSSTLSSGVATKLTLSGIGGEPGVSSNDKVFFVDGNLWLHNLRLFSLALNHGGDGVRVTFVVKGNIYFSDNLLLQNKNTDGVAFIAIKDADVPDSGNIYFGDATFGTLEQMDAFMYAENNFYDTNLNASGSSSIEVNGIMSAGNQVAINRDYGSSHTKLVLNYDSRVADGTLVLPGLPEQGGASTTRTMVVVSCFEVSPD